LQRGRCFEALGIGDLNDRRLEVFEQAFANGDESRIEEVADLGAEIRLRKLEPPQLAQDVVWRYKGELLIPQEEDFEANLEAVRRFRQSLDKPKS